MNRTNYKLRVFEYPKFSVLMSIYHKEIPLFFDKAMNSIWDQQSVRPNEIVLVEDGPLSEELYISIDKWKVKLGKVFKVVVLNKNIGTGDAKNAGLVNCSFDLVAIMDTDDISHVDRFEKQLMSFENRDIDVCGGWINEFEEHENSIKSVRRTPESQQEILDFSKYRSPMNHVTIMFNKNAVIRAGGYKKMVLLEDYYLFVRLIQSGAQLYNIQDPLVSVRAGVSQLDRRTGLRYVRSEFKLQRKMLELGFLTWFEFFINVVLKFFIRILPKQFSTIIYSIIRKL